MSQRIGPLLLALVLSMVAGLCTSCNPDQGERKQEEAYWDKGPPPILRFRGEKIFWDGEWINDGKAVFYDEMGRVVGEGSFEMGKEAGDWMLEQGGHVGRGRFSDGERDGLWTYSYPSGMTQEEGRYDMGKRVGEWRENYSNGKKRAIRVYVDGKLKGEPETWDVDGHHN